MAMRYFNSSLRPFADSRPKGWVCSVHHCSYTYNVTSFNYKFFLLKIMNGQIKVFCYIQLFYDILVYHDSAQVHKSDFKVVSMIHCDKIYGHVI